jgi:hypothetical protein
MGVTTYSWASTVQLEANKCWFYAIIASILLSLHALCSPPDTPPCPVNKPSRKTLPKQAKNSTAAASAASRGAGEKCGPADSNVASGQKTASRPPISSGIATALAVDVCDLLIPGSAIGWITTPTVLVGVAMATSTVLSGWAIWLRVRREMARS